MDFDDVKYCTNDHPEIRSFGQKFTPVEIQSVWMDPESTVQFLTVVILLPSGVSPEDFISVRVSYRGRELELIILWHKPFYCMSTLHKKWLGGDPRNILTSVSITPSFWVSSCF